MTLHSAWGIRRFPAVTPASLQRPTGQSQGCTLQLILVPACCKIILETDGPGKQSSRVLSVDGSQLTVHQETQMEIGVHWHRTSELLQGSRSAFLYRPLPSWPAPSFPSGVRPTWYMREVLGRQPQHGPLGTGICTVTPLKPPWPPPCSCHTTDPLWAQSFRNCSCPRLQHVSGRRHCSSLHALHPGLCLDTPPEAFPEESLKEQCLPSSSIHRSGLLCKGTTTQGAFACWLSPPSLECKHHQSSRSSPCVPRAEHTQTGKNK